MAPYDPSRLVAFTALAVTVVLGCSDAPGHHDDRTDAAIPPAPDDASSDETVGDDAHDDPGPDADDTSAPDADASDDDVPAYPLTDTPYTTLQRTWAPLAPSSETQSKLDDGDLEVTDIEKFEPNGLGVEADAGIPWVIHNELAPGWESVDEEARRSLLYFWQSADPQLIDEESPIRFAGTTIAPMGSTYRPQSHVTLQIYESQVRTARRISERSGRPFDFAFLAGDISDGGQKNEINWTIDILNGGVVHPDSGADNDPVPGPGNDYTDPFRSRGIGVPWYIALGNHETQYMGTFPVTESVREAAVGDEVFHFTEVVDVASQFEELSNGFRDASTRYADVVRDGQTPADQNRQILRLEQALETIQSAPGRPDGHGLELSDALDGRGYFSFKPIAGKPIRFIALNTLITDRTHVSGGIDQEQYDWLQDEIQAADNQNELVLVGAHHKPASFARFSEVGGDEVSDLLARNEHVLAYVAGHGHKNTKRLVRRDGHRGFWEIMCASTVDFPTQSRIIELVYEGDGYLSMYVTNLGQNAPEETLGHWGRELAAARDVFVWGDVREAWRNQRSAMNLVLRFDIPDDVARAIEEESWPERVESTETLRQFDAP